MDHFEKQLRAALAQKRTGEGQEERRNETKTQRCEKTLCVLFSDGFSTSGMRDIKQKEAEDRLDRVNFSAMRRIQAKLSRKKDYKTLSN